ncbi:MAG TPA: GTP cyclohydrolase I FolE [Candidatus Acidoferrales bacterium]|nr:GTP cyclohydrolase I FolE [Candidatus Acidoferrales bacterium]
MTTEPQNTDPLVSLVRSLLAELGEDPERDGLGRTPSRVARSFRYLLSGYETHLDALVNGAIFEVPYSEMVVVRDIEVYSLCEHHLLPFFGKAHVAYIPNGRVLGLSKIPRIVDMFARRLQVQERLTTEIADALQGVLEPEGVGVVIEATHLCMAMRGVEKQNSSAVTSSMTGCLRDDDKSRNEFLSLIRRR